MDRGDRNAGESRDRYKETGRGQNQVSSPNKHQIHAGIRQAGNRNTRIQGTGTRLGNAVRHIQY